ncbi:MAG: VWA domain-containing protein [Azospirillaceae bacterium]
MGDRKPTPPTTGTAADTDVSAFLEQLSRTPAARTQGGKRARLIFALDATASREPTWDRACHLQGEMFEATAQIGGLDVQLVFYRGFRECKATPFVSDARALAERMTKVQCRGGHTQIRRVLQHALNTNAKEPVQAVVFVGDAFEEPVDDVCHLAGQVGLAGVPMFMFHEGGDPVVARVFKEIARLTRGAYFPFNAASANRLGDLLGAVAAYAAGGLKALGHFGEGSRDAGRIEAARQLTDQMTRRGGGR